MENVINEQNADDPTLTLHLSIGEWNGIFGVINVGAFQGVMAGVAENVNSQIRAQNIQVSRSQAEALKVIVPIQLQLGVVNTIIQIINSSPGFATVMQPVADKVTQQAQEQIGQTQANQTINMSPALNLQTNPQ